MKNVKHRKFIRKLADKYNKSEQKFMRDFWLYILAGYAMVTLVYCAYGAGLYALLYQLVLRQEIMTESFVLWATGSYLLLFLFCYYWLLNPFVEKVKGDEIKPEEALNLFDAIEEIKRLLDGEEEIELSRVILCPDYNAGVISESKSRFSLKSEHVLLIGFSYLMAHPVEEFRSTLAHEFGHIIHPHNKIRNWIKRLNSIIENKPPDPEKIIPGQKEPVASYFLPKIIREPYMIGLLARLRVITRAEEFDADSISVVLFGKENESTSLYRAHFMGEAMNRTFWPAIMRRVTDDDIPPSRVLEKMRLEMEKPLTEKDRKLVIQFISNARTSLYSTHPSLRERAAFIGAPPPEEIEWPEPIDYDDSAAMRLLPKPLHDKYLIRYSNIWKGDVISEWRQQHRYEQDVEKREIELDECRNKRGLKDFEEWEYATLHFNRFSEAEKLEAGKSFLESNPKNPDACLGTGMMCLHAGLIQEAEELLEKAATLSSRCREAAIGALFGYYEEFGEPEEQDRIDRKMDDLAKEIELSQKDRNFTSPVDEFFLHGLNEDELSNLCDFFVIQPIIKEVWIVRKRMKYLTDIDHYIILIDFKGKIPKDGTGPVVNAMYNVMQFFGRSCHVIPIQSADRSLRKKIQGVAGNSIHKI